MAKKVLVVKNFVSNDILNDLNQWTLSNRHQEIFNDAGMDKYAPETRFTTRCGNESNAPLIEYPKSALLLKKSIIDYFHLENYKSPPSYSQGIVTGIGYEGGGIHNHIDPVYYPGTKTVHFNVITQKAESGGHTIIDRVKYDYVQSTDLLIYQVSEVYHKVTRTKGKTPRILWVFGFCLDDKKIREIFV